MTIRELAELVGVSKSKIHALLTGERVSVTPDVAARISEALGVHQRALFFSATVHAHGHGRRRSHGDDRHERANDAAAAGGVQELGGHDGPFRPYCRRP